MRKRIYLIGACILILTLIFSTSIFAKRKVLIDFNLLKANGNGIDPAQSLSAEDANYKDYTNHDPVNRTHHMSSLLDYSAVAGSNYTEQETKEMSTSLAAYNWEVHLNSSAAHVINKRFSYCKEWHTKYVPILGEIEQKEGATTTNPEGYTILGIRIHFPETPYNCWALINPPFEIPAYEDKDVDFKGTKLTPEEQSKPENRNSKYDEGYGVLKNVGIIKSIDLRVFGNQFKNSISVLLKDDSNIVTEYQFPEYLDFDGWRQITWNNSNYITEVENRDLYIVPLYPRSTPHVKLYAFRIYRQGDKTGGDFITYIKDIYITYDEAILERENIAIDHESAWEILKERTIEAKQRELRKIGHSQILRYLERKKMHKETGSQ
ncbi:MAG: flagellar protein [Candidatus Lokiarchaeota archaeon]|nr:flagellar protein [Candidatus Lokiarchaeota archaeon]